MKLLTMMALAIATSIAVVSVAMSKTNPTSQEYEDYAVNQLTQYLKNDVCQKTSKLIESLLNSRCDKLVDSTNPQMRDLIRTTTERQDFMLFSVYRTDLTLGAWLPGYKFETVGAFHNFYTYRAEQQ
ncbi:DUF4359 domain-containing protein [Nostoc sp. FACHB-280]|uniref:DUF4359 domain-containing protein n=1 Tax=Nostoc sp. FACHB-280 TaxID=2692839 RepID=UPI00168B9DB8|nr:DUF4359 domain-containing protein [Nostoc sp. FACHB-280]MBD2496650.1 DUF4359 domain-containing protein [Nostoc sp. FACHB-280]